MPFLLCVGHMGHSLTAIQQTGGGGGGYSVCITDEETGAQKAIVELSQTWKLGSLTPDPYWRKTWCYHWVPLQGLAVLSTAGREPTGLPLGRELQPQAPH